MPVYKKGSKPGCSNHRSISSLANHDKIIKPSLNEQNFVYKKLFGFQERNFLPHVQ